MPVLRTGLMAKDLARVVRSRLDLEGCADVYICDPVSKQPIHGKSMVMPGSAVRVWIVAPGHNVHRRECVLAAATTSSAAMDSTVATVNVENGYEYEHEPAVAHEDDESDENGDQDSLTLADSKDVRSTMNLPRNDHGKTEDMVFYAVRKGARTGIFSSKAEFTQAIRGVADAEFGAFASLLEAAKYMNDESGIFERELMSAGSRARHPPKSSAAPAITTETRLDRVAESSAVLMTVDMVVESCMSTRGGSLGIVLMYPSSLQKLERKVLVQMPSTNTASRAELTMVVAALKQAVNVPCYAPQTTLVRVYSSSTYATNCVNEYCKTNVDSRTNADVLRELSALLKQHKLLAYWTPTTNDKIIQAKQCLARFRLNGRADDAPIMLVES